MEGNKENIEINTKNYLFINESVNHFNVSLIIPNNIVIKHKRN
jgi:hypothetical protein